MLRRLSRSDIHGKRVLLRVDFNVPIVGRKVQDDFRIAAALPTIRRLLRHGNTVILLSHHSDKRQTLAPVGAHLTKLFRQRAHFITDPLGQKFAMQIRRATPGELFLVENLTRWSGERQEHLGFARRFAKLGDVFVNDSFGEAHRRRALITLLPRFLPSYLGLRFEQELRMLDRALARRKRPLVAIFGGAKIQTKLSILRRFTKIADNVLVGGAIANTLLAARGTAVGRSPVEPATVAVRRLALSPRIVLPVDAVLARGPRARRARVASIETVRPEELIYDIGPKTARLFVRAIKRARTIVWNGPVGLVEVARYKRGSRVLAYTLARHGNRVIVGGGDTVPFLARAKLLKKFKHVSTGGGAMLAYLAGEKLSALEALKVKITKAAKVTKGAKVRT